MPSLRHQLVAEFVRRTRGGAYASPRLLHDKIGRQRWSRGFEPPPALHRRYEVRRADVAGRTCFTVRASAKPAGRLMYVHGGGFVFEITKHHWAFVGRLAAALDVEVTVPIFPLAPEHTHRETHPFLSAVHLGLAREAGPLTVAGDSTGATLALGVAQRAVRDGGPAADRLLLISPLADPTLTNPAIAEVAPRDPWLRLGGLREGIRLWSGGDDLAGAELNPLSGPLAGLPDTTIVTGTRDLTNPDTRVLRDRLVAQGVPVRYHEHAGLIHVFPLLPVPEAARVLAGLAATVSQPV
jgi:acetyl esterase/lipase